MGAGQVKSDSLLDSVDCGSLNGMTPVRGAWAKEFAMQIARKLNAKKAMPRLFIPKSSQRRDPLLTQGLHRIEIKEKRLQIILTSS